MMRSDDRLRSPGAYILIIELASDSRLRIGKLGSFGFPAGTYAYVGSAMGGLGGRLGRHLDPRRKTHWHVDRLTKKGTILGAFVVPSAQREECEIARRLEGLQGSAAFCTGFGCSDCRCATHLFHVDRAAMDELGHLYGMIVPAEGLIRRSRWR